MEGTMFYFICWSCWVFLTFIVNRQNPYRLKLSCALLMIIILANAHFIVGSYDIYAGGVLMLFIAYLSISKESTKKMIYFFICSFIITIFYVSFHLFEIFDPVWIIFNPDWMMGISLGYLSIILQKTLKGRLLMLISGMMQGEFLYAYILNKYPFPYSIGDFSYLDVCSLTSALLLGWSCLENAGGFFENYFSSIEKGKQKSS